VAAADLVVSLRRVAAAVCCDGPEMTMGEGGHTVEWDRDRDRELEGVLRRRCKPRFDNYAGYIERIQVNLYIPGKLSWRAFE